MLSCCTTLLLISYKILVTETRMLIPECLPLSANMKKILYDIWDWTCKQQATQANSNVSEAQILLSLHRVALPFSSPNPSMGR